MSGGLVLGLGCGPHAVEPPTELAEFCGSDEPVQLLSVGSDDYVARHTAGFQRVGDRWVLGYATYAPGTSHPSYDSGAISTTTIYSTGPCGEDPAAIGEGIDVVYDLETFDAVLMGCRTATGDVLVLDAEGRASPRSLLSAVGCIVRPYAGGIVGVEREPGEAYGTLVFRPSISDPAIPARVVLDGVAVPETDPEHPLFPSLFFHASDRAVLVVTRAGELLSIDPRTGEHSVLRTAVRAFYASTNGRWVLWQEGAPGTTRPEDPGTIRLLDRDSGEDVIEDLGTVDFTRSHVSHDDMVLIEQPDESTRVVLLPSLQDLTVEPELFVSYRHASGPLVLGTGDPSPGIALFGMEPESGDMWLIGDTTIWYPSIDGDLLLIDKHDEWDFDYWRTSVQGGEPELLAEHTYWPAFLSEGRLGAVRDIGANWHGELWIDDPETGESTLLDRRVFMSVLGPHQVLEGTGIDYPWPYGDDVVVWSVHDGNRSGLWAARVK